MQVLLRRVWPIPTVAILLASMLVAPAIPRAHAADAGLVLEALGVIRTRYVDPVDTVTVLNGAIGGLRAVLSSAGLKVTLSDLPSGLPAAQAQGQFRARFDAASALGVGKVTQRALAYAAIEAMTAALRDSHTGFITPEQNRERQRRQRGQAAFSGIGVVLLPRDGRFYVRDVIPASPAAAVGLRALDRIVRVSNVPTRGLQVDQVAGMIRGPEGSTVVIVVERPGRINHLAFTITRRPILVPAVFQARVDGDRIGYVQLYQFVNRTGREFREALDRLVASGMRALVIDVRGNHGGYLHELTVALEALLPPGKPVYQETTRSGRVRTVRTSERPVLPTAVPLVVLIDEGSASAAELLSAAIREHGRGILVGEKTGGAVEASIIVDLSDGSALSVTVQRLATGLGRRLEGVGVTPDVSIAQRTADLDEGRDTQLLRAFMMAKRRTSRVPSANTATEAVTRR